jgi:hypothetical protein
MVNPRPKGRDTRKDPVMSPSPSFLNLDEAASKILEACQFTTSKGRPKPFLFIVGPGICYPPIPLSAQIEAECRKRALKRGAKASPGTLSPMDAYSYWFSKAFPHPEQREDYFKNLTENKPISFANSRLAHLLLANSLGNIVIT